MSRGCTRRRADARSLDRRLLLLEDRHRDESVAVGEMLAPAVCPLHAPARRALRKVALADAASRSLAFADRGSTLAFDARALEPRQSTQLTFAHRADQARGLARAKLVRTSQACLAGSRARGPRAYASWGLD
jgi:hypothetical protein